MSLTPSPAAPAAAVTYCRQARRLRARFGADPARLQVALRDLARSEDRRPPVPDFSDTTPGPARLFSSRVSAALTDGLLRYSARTDLLREAARMGIGRFEATLLIAAVQHADGRALRPAARTPSPRPVSSTTPLIALAALALQTVIAAAVWWVVHA
jgi:hypothetical protein